MKRRITIIGIFVLLICTLITGCNSRGKDIFKKLYFSPAREDVLKEFGEPSQSVESDGEIWNDIYDEIEFMGEKGELRIFYRGRGYVTSAEFEVLFPSSNASNKQVANKYADAISKLFSRKYGEADLEGYWYPTNCDELYIYNLIDYSGDNFDVTVYLN